LEEEEESEEDDSDDVNEEIATSSKTDGIKEGVELTLDVINLMNNPIDMISVQRLDTIYDNAPGSESGSNPDLDGMEQPIMGSASNHPVPPVGQVPCTGLAAQGCIMIAGMGGAIQESKQQGINRECQEKEETYAMEGQYFNSEGRCVKLINL
jgi:hypothetical protein